MTPAARIDTAVAAVAIGTGAAALLLLPAQIPGETLAAATDMRSPAFFPVVSAGIAILAGLGVLAQVGRLPAEDAPPERPARGVAMAVLILAGALLTPVLGGLPAIFLLMLASAWLMGERRAWRAVLLAAIAVLVVHLLFERTLKVLLPPGVLMPGLLGA